MATRKKAAKKAKAKAPAKKAKKAKKAAAKAPAKKARKTAAKAPAKKARAKKIGGLVDPPDDSALSKYRAKTEKQLDKLITDSRQVGEELFGAIDSARSRYSDEWEKMQRRHLSIQMAVWRVRPSRKDVKELKAGIDREVAALEASWEATSKQVREAISVLTSEED